MRIKDSLDILLGMFRGKGLLFFGIFVGLVSMAIYLAMSGEISEGERRSELLNAPLEDVKSIQEGIDLAINDSGPNPDQLAAEVVADLICILSDEDTWDELFEGLWDGEEQSEEELAELDEEAQEFWLEHGYSDEDEASQDVNQYWGTESFKAKVTFLVEGQCADQVAEATLDLQELLNSPDSILDQ